MGLFRELNYKKQTAQSVADQQMVKEWLQCIVELPQYFDLFIENGYESIKFIKTMQSKTELQEIGIHKLGLQTLLWSEIKNLKENDEAMKTAKFNKTNNRNMQYNNHQYQKNNHNVVPIVIEGAGNMQSNVMMNTHNTQYNNTNYTNAQYNNKQHYG